MTSSCDTLRVIRRRRSVRHFLRKDLPAPVVRRLLEAGRWAPSGLNNQPWRFCVIKDAALRGRLAALTAYGAVIRRAPLVIAVALDNADSYNREKDLMAVGAAIQNMLLAAVCLKLGACWLGEIVNKKEQAARLLGWTTDLELTAVLAVGYPARPSGKGRRRPLGELILRV
ncbi:MAG: nitroreductase family protein [Deltaproteobacteria bacterium]